MIHPTDYQRRKEWFESDLKQQFGVEYHEYHELVKPLRPIIDYSLRENMLTQMSEADFDIRPSWNEVPFEILTEDEDDYT